MGLLLPLARGDASVHLAVRRSRHSRELSQSRRLRLAHLPVDQRQGRDLLGEIPLQDRPGDQEPDVGKGGRHRRHESRSPSSGSAAVDRGGAVPVLDGEGADHAGGRGGRLSLQPVRSHQGLVLQGLPADHDRQAHAQPQSRQLLRGSRAGRFQSGQLRARHRTLARQDAAGSPVRLRRHPALSPWHQPYPASGQPAAHPGRRAELWPRRRHALRRQRRAGQELRAQQLRRPGRDERADLCRRRGERHRRQPQAGTAQGRQRLRPGRRALSADEAGGEGPADRQHRGQSRQGEPRRHHRPRDRPLPGGRPRLRRAPS